MALSAEAQKLLAERRKVNAEIAKLRERSIELKKAYDKAVAGQAAKA